jgi:hypothetical protein
MSHLRLAALAGSRFNALRTNEQEVKTKKGWTVTCPASHSSVTHHGARVAPQRCPILRVSSGSITRREQQRSELLNFISNFQNNILHQRGVLGKITTNLSIHRQGRGHGQENPRASYGNKHSYS